MCQPSIFFGAALLWQKPPLVAARNNEALHGGFDVRDMTFRPSPASWADDFFGVEKHEKLESFGSATHPPNSCLLFIVFISVGKTCCWRYGDMSPFVVSLYLYIYIISTPKTTGVQPGKMSLGQGKTYDTIMTQVSICWISYCFFWGVQYIMSIFLYTHRSHIFIYIVKFVNV